MLGLHYVRNVVHREILALFNFLLGLATLSNVLSRYAGRAVTGRKGRLPEAQRRGTVRARSAPYLLRMPVHCLPGRHGLIGFLAFLFSRSNASFTLGSRRPRRHVSGHRGENGMDVGHRRAAG